MKKLTSSTNLAKIIYALLSVIFLAIGVKAMTDNYGGVALFCGLFCGITSTKFWHLQKEKDQFKV